MLRLATPRNAYVDAEEDDDALHVRNDVKAAVYLILLRITINAIKISIPKRSVHAF